MTSPAYRGRRARRDLRRRKRLKRWRNARRREQRKVAREIARTVLARGGRKPETRDLLRAALNKGQTYVGIGSMVHDEIEHVLRSQTSPTTTGTEER